MYCGKREGRVNAPRGRARTVVVDAEALEGVENRDGVQRREQGAEHHGLGEAQRPVHAEAAVELRVRIEQAAADLGSGRMAVSETEVPIISVNLV
jgi:hypothetical protein